MHHEYRHGNLLQVFGEISLREGDNAIVMRLSTAHHALAPPILDDRLRGFYSRPVETIEWSLGQVAIKLRAIGRKLRLHSVEHFSRFGLTRSSRCCAASFRQRDEVQL